MGDSTRRMRNNRIIIPFDDFYDQFTAEVPPRLKEFMDAAEFDSCIRTINKSVTQKSLSLRKLHKLRVTGLIVFGVCFIAAPVIVLLSGNRSPIAFLVPSSIFFFIFVIIAVSTFRKNADVAYQAAASTENVLRDFNVKHSERGLTWRLHKKSNINEDYGFEDDSLSTQSQRYSYWIEIEISQSDFSVVNEPEVAPQQSKQQLSQSQSQSQSQQQPQSQGPFQPQFQQPLLQSQSQQQQKQQELQSSSQTESPQQQSTIVQSSPEPPNNQQAPSPTSPLLSQESHPLD